MTNTEVCTKERPYPHVKIVGVRWQHPDAVYQRDIDKGDYDVEEFICPHCNLTFEVELPD